MKTKEISFWAACVVALLLHFFYESTSGNFKFSILLGKLFLSVTIF